MDNRFNEGALSFRSQENILNNSHKEAEEINNTVPYVKNEDIGDFRVIIKKEFERVPYASTMETILLSTSVKDEPDWKQLEKDHLLEDTVGLDEFLPRKIEEPVKTEYIETISNINSEAELMDGSCIKHEEIYLKEENTEQIINYWTKPYTLNEILEDARNIDLDKDLIPDEIVIFPPKDGDITDEDSGEEDNVVIGNLPGAQLRAEAEVKLPQSLSVRLSAESDNENDLSLSQFVKRKKVVKPRKRKYEFSWTKNDIFSDLPAWTTVYGPKQKLSPLEAFFLFFDDEIINMLVTYTNIYAGSLNRSANVTINEIHCFIGILLLSGYSCLPRREMYWEKSPDTINSLVCVALSRSRFRHIMQNIHCCDNANLNDDDKFSKLRPFIELLNKKFIDLAPIEEHHTVDESMVPYYGRQYGNQFLRGKPIRWGYKFWTATSKSGYIEWFEPYQGVKTKLSDKYKDLGLEASVVLQFVDALESSNNHIGHHIFFNDSFTSLPLLSELTLRGFKGTGIIRENRVPKDCPIMACDKMKKEPRGSFDFTSTDSNDIIVCRWHDNNIVTIASNHSKALPTGDVKRFSQKENTVYIRQPSLNKIYNENMGGVDRANQNINLYRVSVRGKKWYFPIISYFVDMAEHNAWRIYKVNGGELDHLEFRRSVAVGLLQSFKKISSDQPKYNGMDHLVVYQERQTRCVFCHKKCNFCCQICTVTLHPKICFKEYHTK